MDKTRQFIALECYRPYYTVKKSQYTPSYEEVQKNTFYTKIRIDMIARLDGMEEFYATPISKSKEYFDHKADACRRICYQRVVVLCPTSMGMNGFQDSLYITERCIKPLEKKLDEVFGTAL